LCNMTAMEAQDDIYECPVVWKGRSNSASAGAATGADYAAEPPSTTSSSTTQATSPTSEVGVIGTGEVTRTSTTRRTTTTPTIPTPVVAAPSPTGDDKESDDDSEDDSDDDSDDDSEEFDDRRLAKRNTPIIAVDPVNTGSTLPSNGANGQLTVFATNEVELPASVNTTSGEVGIVLSKQCVQMLVWPNQMYVILITHQLSTDINLLC
jgi:hypothetical protein